MKKHILIVGSGSIGQRHAVNLSKLGCIISCIDLRVDRISEIKSKVNINLSFNSLEEALANENYDGIVICTPTLFHPEQTKAAIKKNIPILLEKPISKSLSDANKVKKVIKKNSDRILLGYTWRWWKPFKTVSKNLNKKLLGEIKHVQFHMSAHLADWHPWEPYQEFFMSSKELGGGALLDESHWIDLMIWFFGMPKNVRGNISKISDLEIDSDDNVDVICEYEGFFVTIHLDLYGRPHEKFIRFVGNKGTMFWSANPNQIKVSKDWDQNWDEHNFNIDRNDMFVSLAKDFVDFIDYKKLPICNYNDGINVMRVIEAIRKSNSTGKKIQINEEK